MINDLFEIKIKMEDRVLTKKKVRTSKDVEEFLDDFKLKLR